MLLVMSAAYYVERGRRPRNCYDCDGVHACRCDAVTIRAAKRGAKAIWQERMREEMQEPPLDFYRDVAACALAVRGLSRGAD